MQPSNKYLQQKKSYKHSLGERIDQFTVGERNNRLLGVNELSLADSEVIL